MRTERLSHTLFILKIVSLDDECRRHCLEVREFGSKGGINHKKREENATMRQRHYHVTDVDEKIFHHKLSYQITLSSLTKNNTMHSGLRGD